jgi:hypothetical protein
MSNNVRANLENEVQSSTKCNFALDYKGKMNSKQQDPTCLHALLLDFPESKVQI